MSTLYIHSAEVICENFKYLKSQIESLPQPALCDILYMMAKGDKVREIKDDLINHEKFVRLLLGASQKLNELHYVFKNLMNDYYASLDRNQKGYSSDEDSCNPAFNLASGYGKQCSAEMHNLNHREFLIRNGKLLGDFLYDAGWYFESALVLRQCLFLSMACNDSNSLMKSLSCCERLLRSQSNFNMFQEAGTTFKTSLALIDKLNNLNVNTNFAKIYIAFSSYNFMECRYNDALKWSIKALTELTNERSDIRVVIDVFRQGAKCLAVKREFPKAKLLITEAVHLSKDLYGAKSSKYADALLDYGYYLINSDSVRQAVTSYTEVLNIRKEAFGRYNLMTAIAFEDLAYALYVREYSSGNFTSARQYSEEAIKIMTLLLPKKHIQLASARRVVALILEEIAIDSSGTPMEPKLLKESERLHLAALNLSIEIFGEMNVQTAKHYGNLGRLYQSMKKYDDAECMHLKSISIKEKLLGMYDYEVALSVGHLASLYNYDMHQYDKAEQLHLRSIKIGRKLFGDAYTGLEYDYRGLIQVYNVQGNMEDLTKYNRILSDWRVLQDLRSVNVPEEKTKIKLSRPVVQVLNDFFETQWTHLGESKHLFDLF